MSTERPNTNTIGTNTLPVSNIGIVNLEQKKKPHNINIRNHNPHEPKISPNLKYSDLQRYRRYKTKTEPNLLSKILINEEDNIVNKIKEAFGIKPENAEGYTIGNPNTNFSEEITAPSAYYKGVDEPPEIETKMYSSDRNRIQERYKVQRREQGQQRQQTLLEELNDISMEDAEELTYQYRPATDAEAAARALELEKIRLSSERTLGDLSSERTYKFDAEKMRQRFNDGQAKLLQYNYRKHLSKKEGKLLAKDLAGAKALNQMLEMGNDLTLNPIVRNNKAIGLNWETNSTPKRKERYSLGLDRALPTPTRFQFQPVTKDAGTEMRGPGRPPESAYKTVKTYNPARVSVGEMVNPSDT